VSLLINTKNSNTYI